jgi:predicted phage-related endonuclease
MPTAVSIAAMPVEPEGEIPVDELSEHIELLRQVARKIEGLTSLRTELQSKIKNKLGDAETGTVAGRPVVTWKRTLRVAVSQKLLKERFPEIVSDVSDITEVRTFKVLDQ